MHVPTIGVSGLLFVAMLGSPAFAQAKKGAPPATTVRYFQFLGDFLGDLAIDGFLRETRQGGRVIAAVLDLCHPNSNDDPRKDRFVVDLKVEAGKLTGTGQSQEQKLPVAVNLNRKQTGKTIAFTGFITRGQTRTEVNSAENSDISEDEFRDDQPAEEVIVGAPPNFTEVSPGSVAIRVERQSLIGVVNELKSERVVVQIDGLATGCTTLRSGVHIVRAEVDPERAPALVARWKTLPGVTNVGWTSGDYPIDYAVRMEGAAWRGADGKPDRGKLASSIADSIAKSLGAKVDAATWDNPNGELSLKLARPNREIPQLELTDIFEFTAIVGSEKPGEAAALVVWLKYTGLDTVDRGPEPRLKFSPAAGDREWAAVSMESILRSLARDLQGQHWDSAGNAWQ